MWWCDLHSVTVIVHVTSIIITKIGRRRYPLQMGGWNVWCQVSHVGRWHIGHLHLHRLRHKRWDGRDVIAILNRELIVLSVVSVL